MTTRSPVAAACFLGASSQRLLWLASCLICSSTALFVGFDRQPLELEIVDLRRRNVGQRFEADLDLGVLAGLIAFVELDLRLQRRADLLLLEQLLDAVLDRALQRVAAGALRRASCG